MIWLILVNYPGEDPNSSITTPCMWYIDADKLMTKEDIAWVMDNISNDQPACLDLTVSEFFDCAAKGANENFEYGEDLLEWACERAAIYKYPITVDQTIALKW